MVVVFIKPNIESEMMNETTIIPCGRVSIEEIGNSVVAGDPWEKMFVFCFCMFLTFVVFFKSCFKFYARIPL